MKNGQLVYTDVSEKWLEHTAKKLKPYTIADVSRLYDFKSIIAGGEYDKIVIHYTLHDFPVQYRVQIINQLTRNLKHDGMLFIREPISAEHGMKLHELINLIESVRSLSYEYKLITKRFIGEYADIKCHFKD